MDDQEGRSDSDRSVLTLLGAVPAITDGAGSAGGVDAPTGALRHEASPDYYKNLIAPGIEFGSEPAHLGSLADASNGTAAAEKRAQLAALWRLQAKKYSGGFPRAARVLGRLEAKAARTGRSPRDLKLAQADAPAGGRQVAQVLTILAEFNPNAADDFSGWERPTSYIDPTCVTDPSGTTQSGPLHNNLPNPATVGRGTDNNTFWVPDFSRSHFQKILFTKKGLTQRIRKDLRRPSGKRGVSLRSYTMRNMFLEMSKGAYTVDGEVSPWVELPHSEGYYGADSCEAGIQSDVGHPDNPRGVTQMIVDAVDTLASQQPDFPWERYDVEDQGDLDGDGNLLEPDGVIDHFNIVHSGADEADGGGDEGTYAIWSHSSVVDAADGGYEIPGTDLKVFNYITQAEDAGTGEFGHDLGLPDLYDTSGGGDSDVEFWDLMSTGSHSGTLFQGIPTHMGAWDKYVLGWNDPVETKLGGADLRFKLGQASRPPEGTADSFKVNLPDKVVSLGEPHSGSNMWWSSNDQSLADLRLQQQFDVPAGSDVRFWVWNNYQIEEDWDYGFIEVSTDGGSTWTQENVYDESGTLVSTPDDYSDPNGNLENLYGGLEHGLTGFTDGWRHDYIDLTPYAGQTIDLRLRYVTDFAWEERGWFADDFELTADGQTVFSDDVENGMDGWTPEVASFGGTTGRGWHIFSGTATYEQYYIGEWRSYHGFDRGLKYAYDTTYFNDREWRVEKVPYNAPGLLLYYRNAQYSSNHVTIPLFDLPSVGAKGTLLIVDSHFDPLRRHGRAAKLDPEPLNNIPSRPQASNAAFGLRRTPGFRSCIEEPVGSYRVACNRFGGQSPVRRFSDGKGWYPGIEVRGEDLFFRDVDASVVIPSRGNKRYSTRIVDRKGRPMRELYGEVLADILVGSGNPSDGNPNRPRNRAYGVAVRIKKVGPKGKWASIRVNSGRRR